MTGVPGLAATWATIWADGGAWAVDRFRRRVRRGALELFHDSMTEAQIVFATLGRLVTGTDDPAGRAAGLAVLGRWFRTHRLPPGRLWLLGEALLGVWREANRPVWSQEAAAEWDRAFRDVAFDLLRAAGRATDGPGWLGATVVTDTRPAAGMAVLTVRPDRPVLFRPGQAVPLGSPDRPGLWRWYSPANAPRADGSLDLHIRAVEQGALSRYLVGVRAGGRLRIGPPTGRNLVPGRIGRRDLLLIAGGTGLAPLRAIVEQAIEAGNHGRQVTLVVGARTVDDLYDMATLDAWQSKYDWLTVLPAVCDDPGSVHPVARGTAVRVALRHHWPEHDVYVCGPTAMIHDALPRLVVAGYPLARIHVPELYDREPPVGKEEDGEPPLS